MFEDCLRPRKTNGRALSQKLAVLGIVVAAHGLVVYGLFRARMTIKMLTIGTTVRNVTIVPPLKLSLPKVVGAPKQEAAGTPAEGAPAGAGPSPGTRRAAPREEAPAGPPGPAPRPGETQAGQGPTIAALSKKFQESLAARFKSGQESEFSISFAPFGSKAGAAAPARGNAPDFYQYIPGVTVGRAGTGSGAYGGRGGGAGGQRASISIPLKGYNLAPWAQKVLELIQRNWELPWAGGVTERTSVRVILVIRKSGEVSSIELVEGSARDALDQAALKAVRESLPFPALPDDFPGDFLEASIEFVYHD